MEAKGNEMFDEFSTLFERSNKFLETLSAFNECAALALENNEGPASGLPIEKSSGDSLVALKKGAFEMFHASFNRKKPASSFAETSSEDLAAEEERYLAGVGERLRGHQKVLSDVCKFGENIAKVCNVALPENPQLSERSVWAMDEEMPFREFSSMVVAAMPSSPQVSKESLNLDTASVSCIKPKDVISSTPNKSDVECKRSFC